MTGTQLFVALVVLLLAGGGLHGLIRGEVPMAQHGGWRTKPLPPLRGAQARLFAAWLLAVAAWLAYRFC